MGSVFFIALRRLRAPFILIILVFVVATVGLVLIPGVDGEGRPYHLSVFQAFYFVTYTATTIGFGEVPHPFTDEQRLWVVLIIYLSVIGWAFLLGSLLGLSQDKGFQHAIVTARFRRAVAALREPFFLVCGLGETGLMVVQALDRLGGRFVVLDVDAARLAELELLELRSDALALNADARAPETLILAGLRKKECRGVLALSSSDAVNLAIAISVRLLHPGLPAICRAQTAAVAASMETVGTYQTINPFVEFGEHLLLAMTAPERHRLLTWLTGPPDAYLRPRVPTPPGRWVVCGYGRFGAEVVAAIRQGGFEVTVIDPVESEEFAANAAGVRYVRGLATNSDDLRKAGVATAPGLVAGTDDDTANLAIVIAARQLNPGLFIIARQNLVANRTLFTALGADMTMVSSQIVANECVAILRTPLLAELLRIVRRKDDVWAHAVIERLVEVSGQTTPEFWSFEVSQAETPGLYDLMHRLERPITVADLRRSASDPGSRSQCCALLLVREGRSIELPADSASVRAGDKLLFAGTRAGRIDQREVVRNATIAGYVIAGRGRLGGTVWQWLSRRTGASSPDVPPS